MKWGEITYSKTPDADMKPDNQVARHRPSWYGTTWGWQRAPSVRRDCWLSRTHSATEQ